MDFFLSLLLLNILKSCSVITFPPKNHVVYQNMHKRVYHNHNHPDFFTDNEYDKENMKLITISPGGFNGFYMMGIVSFIKDHYNLTNFIFSGASAGAWNAVVFSYKYNASDLIDILFDDRNDANTRTSSLFPLPNKKNKHFILDLENSIKNRILDKFSSADFNLDRLFIGMTTLQCNGFKTHIYNDFENLGDALDACFASSHIPFLTGNVLLKYKGKYYVDGGFSSYPYFAYMKPILEITPSIWKRMDIYTRPRFSNWGSVEEYTTLFSSDKMNFTQLFLNGYNDALINKPFLDSIFVNN